MSLNELKDRLPEYAKDLKLNLSNILGSAEGMTEQQHWGTLVASTIASRNAELTRAALADAPQHLSPEALTAAKAAAAIMGMNNVYYRFLHLVSNKEYGSLPARLRMNVIANPGVDKADFELWSLAVSAINGCGMCLDAHEKQLVQAGVGKEAVQQAVRIAAIIHAIAAVLDAKAAAGA